MKSCIRSCVFFFLLITTHQAWARLPGRLHLQTGDLIFQDLDCGPLCDAIEQVTTGYRGHTFSHIGLVYIRHDSTFVIEAIGKEVQLTTLKKFSARTTKKMYIGRIKKQWQHLIPQAIDFALQQMHTPYDDAFLYGNGRYYCSELIYDAFKSANKGNDFFVLEPMTFKQPGTTDFFPAWISYYEKLSIPIPEGQPGINPGGISTSPRITILNP